MSGQDAILRDFDRRAADDPGRVALATPRERCTFAELDALSRRIAEELSGSWLRPGQLVGLRAANGPGFLAGFLAARRAGLAPLLMDAATPFAERMRVAQSVGAGMILTCGPCWPDGDDDAFELEPIQSLEPYPLTETAAAAVKLTSGSTGAPRGIAAPAEALLADDAQLRAAMGIADDDRLLAAIPFSHSYGLSSLVVPCLVRGVLLVLPDSDRPFGPLEAAHALQATVFPTVPAYLGGLARIGESIELPPSLRRFVSAGAPLPAATAARFRELFGQPVHTFYGSSESGGICFDREGGAAERGTVGAPIDGVEVRLERVDGDGAPLRVAIRSAAVAETYLPEPEARLAAGRFLSDDLAEWRDGEIAIVGRLGDLINVKGNKVNPREVEAVLSQLAEVEDVYVMGIPDEDHRGEAVRAVVACRSGGLRAEDVISWCRRRLSGYKIPRSVVMVREVPRTSRGKVDREALLRLGTETRLRGAPDDG